MAHRLSIPHRLTAALCCVLMLALAAHGWLHAAEHGAHHDGVQLHHDCHDHNHAVDHSVTCPVCQQPTGTLGLASASAPCLTPHLSTLRLSPDNERLHHAALCLLPASRAPPLLTV